MTDFHNIHEAMEERVMACVTLYKWGFEDPFAVFRRLIGNYTTMKFTVSEVQFYRQINGPNGYAILRALMARRGLTKAELK